MGDAGYDLARGHLGVVRQALSGLTDKLPRRAVVLPDGSLGDRCDYPCLAEVSSVSLACEAVRRAGGEAIYPRHTAQLMQLCLSTNDPSAWRALLADATTGDLDLEAARLQLGGDNAALLVRRLTESSSGMHMWTVIRFMQLIMPAMPVSVVSKLAQAFQQLFGDIVKALTKRVRDVSVDMRASAITELGKLMVWTDIPESDLAEMLEDCLARSPDEVLRLFLFAPIPAMLAHCPDLPEKLLLRAERASQATRYPTVAMLAMLPAPVLKPHEARVMELVKRALETGAAQGTMDAKLALVCSTLVKDVAPSRSLYAGLAHALSCATYHLCHPRA